VGLSTPLTSEAVWSAQLDALIEAMLREARIPGAAIAIARGHRTIFARGYGYSDLECRRPMTADVAYPIASTTKALNATLLGMLVDAGHLAWDEPVQRYLPHVQLRDPTVTAQVTLRDLVTMRTGLPRHDWLWLGNPMGRAELAQRMRYLEPSAGVRERFQYNNLTATLAGHVAETVMGQSWEEQVRARILQPLQMQSTGFGPPAGRRVTRGYHENGRRELTPARHLAAEATAPSGGAIYSTVEDMAHWLRFNLNCGLAGDRQLIAPQTLREIHSPQLQTGIDAAAPTPNAAYAIGWFVDIYNARPRLSHGGQLHDVNSEVMLFPDDDLAIVAFTNFGSPRLSRLLAQHAFDLMMGLETRQSLGEALAQYEQKVADNCKRIAVVPRVLNSAPSRPLSSYVGTYVDPGYGAMEIARDAGKLILRRGELLLPLQHWHYDNWVADESDLFEMQKPHAFDRASQIAFELGVDREVVALRMALEPSVGPIRFERRLE
jgi:CubicO group peptidase (beta-lactamase class C family)